MSCRLPLLAALVLAPIVLPAQTDPATLTLDRIQSGELRTEGFGPVRWLADGSGYTTLENAKGGGRDLVRYDPGSGKRTVLVAASQLIPSGRDRPLRIADYAWSQDATKLVVFTNTRRVWRYHTRGDYWVLDRASGKLTQLGAGLEEATLQFAKLSPDGTRAGYVQANDVWVEDVATGSRQKLTEGGSATLSNGTFDWVYEEEWGLRDGFRWSPDGKRIAYWQIDASGVGVWTLIENTAGLYPKLKQFPYPKVGTKNPACRVGVVSADGGKTTWLDLPGDARDDYVARMEWAASSDEVVVQRVNRLQNENRILLANVRTGKARTVFTDRDDAWVDIDDDLTWVDDGSAFLLPSDRDGWRHVWRVPRAGGEPTLITPGDYDVVSIQCIDQTGGWIYVIASPKDPTQRFLYRVPIKGGPPIRLTPTSAPGTHAYQVAPDASYAIHTTSSFGSPPKIALVQLPKHATIRTFVDNQTLRDRVAKIAKGPAGFFRVETDDGIALDGWMIRPPDFDPTKRYPTLVHVYGEPAGQTVLDRWGVGYYTWHLMLAQKGYVILSIDNRGTPGPRGRAFRKSVYGQIGTLASHDQAAALRAAQKKFPFLDPTRVGIWGWSGGGSMTLNMLFRHPDLYHMGMAIAFIANQRFYDTIYQERYMGLPTTNAKGYREGSPITHAKNLRGDLLIIYGTGDDNCHYQNCEALVNELIRHGKQFRMMAYPNRSHGIHEGPGTRRHLFEMMTRYVEEKLPAGGR